MVIWGVAGVGAISVIAEDEFGCQGTTSEIDITINVNEIDISDQILVYPNPNSGEFSILVSFADLQQTQITISDVTGKIIYNEQLNNKTGNFKQEVVLSNVSKGIYYVQLKSDKYIASKKLIVK